MGNARFEIRFHICDSECCIDNWLFQFWFYDAIEQISVSTKQMKLAILLTDIAKGIGVPIAKSNWHEMCVMDVILLLASNNSQN